MDLRRVRVGEWLAAISGAALFASLFLPWYGTGEQQGNVCIASYGDTIAGGGVPCGTATGWQSLAAIDILLACVAAAGILIAVVTATHAVPAVPVAISALVSLVGLVGVILVLLRALDLPDWAGGREWGLWLALASSAGIIAGAMLAMRDEMRPAGTRVEIEAIPAPRP
jgi:hypothetical protein